MNDKERAAMQQALEALEELHYSSGTVVAAKKYESATAALREALDQDIDCPCGSECIKCSPRVLLAEQVEQEPIYISESCAERGCACHYSVEVDGEPVTVYSAPVRTKDLTDDEILEITKRFALGIAFPVDGVTTPEMFARAVIAADREKNK